MRVAASTRRGIAVFLATFVAVMGYEATPASAAEPELGLRAVKQTIKVKRRPNRPALVDPGVYFTVRGSALELHVGRDDYQSPIEITQIVHDQGATIERPLPPDILDEWWGLKDFMRIVVRNPKGRVVSRNTMTYCPNSYERERVGDEGSPLPRYPTWCSASFFTKSMVWGIDAGWASRVRPYRPVRIKGRDGTYKVITTITPRYRSLFGIAPEVAREIVNVKVTTGKRRSCRHCVPPHHRRAAGTSGGTESVPTLDDPDPSILPDLVAAPSFGISLRDRKKRESLSFGAMVWTAGASSLVVEGFRRESEAVMDAFQYFYDGDEVVGRSEVGSLEFDTRRGHNHWHFKQFAAYRLVDAAGDEMVRSKKEAFCLAPTDPMDLALPGAEWNPESTGFWTNCGRPRSLWVREVLPLGWGDTYFQGLPGQSFNVTNLPNGVYYIEVEANPGGLLHEQDSTNNVERRKVRIKGKPGRRRVVVPPWNGIDTEGTRGEPLPPKPIP